MNTRSDCAVLRSVVLGVLHSPDHITTDALDVSCSAVNQLEQHFRVTDHRSRGYRVTTCRLWLTFISGLHHHNVLISPREITTNIKHVLPAVYDKKWTN